MGNIYLGPKILGPLPKGLEGSALVLLPSGTFLGLEHAGDKIDKTGFTMLCETDRPREF